MKKIKSLFLCIFIFCLILTTQKVEANTVVKPEIATLDRVFICGFCVTK